MSFEINPQAIVQHLELLGKNGQTRYRGYPPKRNKGPGGQSFGHSDRLLDRIKAQHDKGRNVGIVVNNGGDKKESITDCTAFFLDFDDGDHADQLRRIEESDLPEPTFRVRTHRGYHFYWSFRQPMRDIAAWEAATTRLIHMFGSDGSCKDASRVMRLAGTLYVNDSLQVIDVAGIEGITSIRYDPEDVISCLPVAAPVAAAAPVVASEGVTREAALEVLRQLPARAPGTGTRDAYLRMLWGFASLFGPEEAGLAFATHMPEWQAAEDLVEKARESDGRLKIGTFFHEAKRTFGVATPKGAATAPTRTGPASEDTVGLIRSTFDQLLQDYPNDNRLRLVHRCRELIECDLDVRPTQDLYRRELAEAYLRRDGVEIRPFKAGDLLPTEDLPCLVEGVFIQGALNIVGADPKCGKTLFVVSMLAAMLHESGTWLGRAVAPPPAVVLIGPDQPVNIWSRQLRRVGLLQEGRLHPKLVRLWDSTNPWAAGEEGLAELRALCLAHPGCLVVVDSLAKVCEKLGLDENSAEIGGVVSDIERAVVSAGGTPLLIHHNAKGASRSGINGGGALRGSGTIRANASQVASLSHINAEDTRDPRRRLTTEGRLGCPIDIVIEADWDSNSWRAVCDYSAVRKELQVEKKRQNLTEFQEQLLAIVGESEGAVTSRWVYEQLYPDAAPYNARCSEAKEVYNGLRRLVRNGLLAEGPKVGVSYTFCQV